ncbi:MAG TPA: wax ester/triacylglycerol synthase family O-acyltransferase, partial [Alphaproteobacteria bacterium]|nr:wax ester/triacylglycerol synthase family O-acyltransferase [Alphaproteobacteria bacterium]
MGSATSQSARPLSGLDSAFLSLETPTAPMHMTLVIVLEPRDGQPPDVERIRGELAERLLSVPVMRRRLHEEALGIGRPVLADAGAIDVDAHIDRLGAPAPGGAHELADV